MAITAQREPLEYLFEANFDDGTAIQQTQADESVTGKGSAFTDVLNKEGLWLFSVRNTHSGSGVSVDMQSGTFMVNGQMLQLHDQYFDPSPHELKLIYFRETHVTRTGDDVRQYVNRYFVGWETIVEGKKHKAVMAVF